MSPEELALFTHAERTQPKYKLSDILVAARILVDKKVYQGAPMCLDSIHRRAYDNSCQFTLVDVNNIVNLIVDDTIYWA